MVHIGNDWDELLDGEFDKEYYVNVSSNCPEIDIVNCPKVDGITANKAKA